MDAADKDMIATQLLHDISVVLEEEYADPTRELFPFLQPFFSYHRDLPLRQRILESLDSVDDAQRSTIKQGVIEALRRCATQWLGLWRGLEVFDLHQQLAPEALSTELMSRLLCLQAVRHPEQRGIWLDHLLRRWMTGRLNPDIQGEIWLEVVRDVAVDALVDTLAYMAQGPLRLKTEILDCTALAGARLSSAVDSLTPDQYIELTKALTDLRVQVLPSLSQSLQMPTIAFDAAVQQRAETDALLLSLYSSGYPQDEAAATEEAQLAQVLELEGEPA
jgi:hypothetical protein